MRVLWWRAYTMGASQLTLFVIDLNFVNMKCLNHIRYLMLRTYEWIKMSRSLLIYEWRLFLYTLTTAQIYRYFSNRVTKIYVVVVREVLCFEFIQESILQKQLHMDKMAAHSQSGCLHMFALMIGTQICRRLSAIYWLIKNMYYILNNMYYLFK